MALTPDGLRKLRRTPMRDGRNRLKAARELAGLTQQELAGALSMTQSTLSDIERQRWGATTVDTAYRFAVFFGCEIKDLFPAKQEVA